MRKRLIWALLVGLLFSALGSIRPTFAHACQLLWDLAKAEQKRDFNPLDAQDHAAQILKEAPDTKKISAQELDLEIRLRLVIFQSYYSQQSMTSDPLKLIPAIAVAQRLGRWATGHNPRKIDGETSHQYIARLLQYYVDGLDSLYLGETDASLYYYQNLRAFEAMNWAQISTDPADRWQKARTRRQHDLGLIVKYLRELKPADSK